MSEEKIGFLDLKEQYNQIKDEVFEEVQKVFANTAFTNGPSVKKFEEDFAEFCGVNHVVAVNNGTSAVHMALKALDIKQGDEVIVPANTFIATAWGVVYNNATPVFVDCTSDTWQIDPSKIEEKITPKTKAIVGVHLYGQPFDVDAVREIADKHKLFLVEDAAQAHGAYYKGKRAGNLADIASFSFYPGKNLGTFGEGGAVTTNNKEYADRISKLRNHASVNKYYHEEIGYNMRMGGLEGVVLHIKLKYIDKWNTRRKDIAKMYFEGITNSKINMQTQPDSTDSVYHIFVITTENREALTKHLNNDNIFPGMHYPVPCHLQKAFTDLNYKEGDLPNAEYLARHCLSLPMYPELTDEKVKRVIDSINNY